MTTKPQPLSCKMPPHEGPHGPRFSEFRHITWGFTCCTRVFTCTSEGSYIVFGISDIASEGSDSVFEWSKIASEGSNNVFEWSDMASEGSDSMFEWSNMVSEGSDDVFEWSNVVSEGSYIAICVLRYSI